MISPPPNQSSWMIVSAYHPCTQHVDLVLLSTWFYWGRLQNRNPIALNSFLVSQWPTLTLANSEYKNSIQHVTWLLHETDGCSDIPMNNNQPISYKYIEMLRFRNSAKSNGHQNRFVRIWGRGHSPNLLKHIGSKQALAPTLDAGTCNSTGDRNWRHRTDPKMNSEMGRTNVPKMDTRMGQPVGPRIKYSNLWLVD